MTPSPFPNVQKRDSRTVAKDCSFGIRSLPGELSQEDADCAFLPQLIIRASGPTDHSAGFIAAFPLCSPQWPGTLRRHRAMNWVILIYRSALPQSPHPATQ